MSSNNTEDFTCLLKAYLPEKHWDIMNGSWKGWKEMYGATKQEFVDDVIRFASFPGSSSFFDLELASPYITNPTSHTSFDGGVYIYKNDLLIHLQRAINSIDITYLKNNHFISSIVGFYLKTIESQLGKRFELVQFPKETLDAYSAELENKLKAVPVTITLEKTTNIEDFMNIVKKMLPAHERDPDYKSIRTLIEKFQREKLIKQYIPFYEKLLNWVGFIIDDLQKLVDFHPWLFKPKEVGFDEILFVRVFDDGKYKFMLHEELSDAMKALKPDDPEVIKRLEDRVSVSKFSTVDFDEWAAQLNENVDKLKLVKQDLVRRHKHRATLIPCFDGKYCIQIADLWLEIWGEVINAHGYFQKLAYYHWKFFDEVFCHLEKHINQTTDKEQFINICDALEIKQKILKEIKQLFVDFPTQITEVRQLDNKGFTVEKMKNEVARLGLTVSFDPDEVMERAVFSFNHFDGLKKGRVFKTCDLYDALRQLQLALLASKFSGVYCFLHKYRACDILLENCMYCDLDIPFSSLYMLKFGSDESDDENENAECELEDVKIDRKSDERKEKKKRQAEKKKLSKAPSTSETAQRLPVSEAPSADSAPTDVQPSVAPQENNALGIVDVEEQDVINQQPAQQQENIAPEVAPPIEGNPDPEPGACMKCYRTSQHCQNAKTKLREEQIKTKALRKQVREKDKLLEEKEEEIRLLKLKLVELEASKQENNDSYEDDDDEDDPPIRLLAPTYKNSEFTEETRKIYNELLNIRDSQFVLEREATRRVNEVVKEANDDGNKRMARLELRCLQQAYTTYFKKVESNIKWIQEHKNEHLDELAPLPEIPRFSDNFEEIYQSVVMKELNDKTCPVCLVEIEDLKESIKCGCYKRYHYHCAWETDAKGLKCYCGKKLPLD
ncbi:hypothetical protein CAEBREN_20909 [Caenorhabditis brenneri]|uniref:DUF7809 domain-containing protein n=1 Tax=Caenorhabditis brenneri TaxID=135651 RepID=G0NYS1_CAEBE|nr:hypothetical protein CAEBREN_20909 [Caenorhabditis brenneri]